MRSLTVSVPASEQPVTRAEAKMHLRVDGNDEDTLIDALIIAATNLVESVYLWRATTLRTYTLKDKVEGAPCYALSMPPVQSVTTVAADGVAVTGYALDVATGVLTFASAVSGDLEVVYVAGYGDVADVPAQYKQAVLLLVGQWYESREAATFGAQPAKVPYAVEALTLPFRAWVPVQ